MYSDSDRRESRKMGTRLHLFRCFVDDSYLYLEEIGRIKGVVDTMTSRFVFQSLELLLVVMMML